MKEVEGRRQGRAGGGGREQRECGFQAASARSMRYAVQSNQRTDSGRGTRARRWMTWKGGWMTMEAAKMMRRWQREEVGSESLLLE